MNEIEKRARLEEKIRLNRERLLPEALALAPLVREVMTACPDDYMESNLNDPIDYLRDLQAAFNVKYAFDWTGGGSDTCISPIGDEFDCAWIYALFFEADRKTLTDTGKRFVVWNADYWPPEDDQDE